MKLQEVEKGPQQDGRPEMESLWRKKVWVVEVGKAKREVHKLVSAMVVHNVNNQILSL